MAPAAGHVAGPVGDDVQQRAGLAPLGVAEPGGGELRVLAEELLERRGVAGADDVGDLARERRVGVELGRVAAQVGMRLGLGWQAGAGEGGGAVGVVLHAHDAAVADGDDHAGLPTGQSPLLEPRAGDLDEDTLVDGDDGVQAGDDALLLAVSQRGEDLVAVVAVPFAGLVTRATATPGSMTRLSASKSPRRKASKLERTSSSLPAVRAQYPAGLARAVDRSSAKRIQSSGGTGEAPSAER